MYGVSTQDGTRRSAYHLLPKYDVRVMGTEARRGIISDAGATHAPDTERTAFFADCTTWDFDGYGIDTRPDGVRGHGTIGGENGRCGPKRPHRGACVFNTIETITFDIDDHTVVIHIDGAVFNRRVCGCRGGAAGSLNWSEIERFVPDGLGRRTDRHTGGSDG